MKFSVLIPVYYGDKKEYLQKAINSILNQTVMPSEIVVVIDGNINEDVRKLIRDYVSEYQALFNIIDFSNNRGLGYVLHDGINACKYDLIARMDADDICRTDRFEKQLQFMIDNANVDVVGSFITEFEGDTDNIISVRKVPVGHSNINKYSKKRNPFNHMTVMFKKSAVLKAGNYQHFLWFEDYYLWVRMILDGCKMHNIPESLVYARAGQEMYMRRGGFKYLINDIKLQWKFFKLDYTNSFELIRNILLRTFVRIVPNSLRAKLYMKYLRN